MAALLKLLTLRKPISGMGKRFYGILSEEVRQTIEKTIEEEMEKIVQQPNKEHQQKAMDEINMDFAKMIAEQYQKQMAMKNFQKKVLKKLSLSSQEDMEKEYKEFKRDSKNEMKELTMASVPILDNPKMANLDQQIIKVSKPAWNRWDKILIQLEGEDFDGLFVHTESDKWCTEGLEWHNVFAFNGFPISREHHGNGAELSTENTYYYYEVIVPRWDSRHVVKVGLSGGLPADYIFGDFHPNFYYLSEGCDHCCLSGTEHEFELPNRAIKSEWKSGDSRSRSDDIIGCGILLHSNGKLFIFFTLNGNLMGKPIPITPSVDRLYPTVRMAWAALTANFGHDLAKPFKFDIGKCPELELE